jgi:hypothetical protein
MLPKSTLMGAHPRKNLASDLIYVESEKKRADSVDEGLDLRTICLSSGKEGGGGRHTSLLLEAHGPMMVPPSTARRGRGRNVRSDIGTETRKGEAIGLAEMCRASARRCL